MRSLPRFSTAMLSARVVLSVAAASPFVAGAQIEPAEDAPRPRSPGESAEQFDLEPGFLIELVAAEPLVSDPSGVAFDAHGRVFVCELHGYNLEGHLDILELNKTGRLDMEVRRIQAHPDAVRRADAGIFGAVKRLLDDDGDGLMDRAVVWADDLPPCYGLVAARDGVIVVCDPDIVYIADRDHDGAPDFRETLLTGFVSNHALEAHLNTPRWGLDGWIHVVARGAARGQITGPHLDGSVTLGNTDFRFKADGSAIEAVTGDSHGFGHAFTSFGQRFLVNNSNHALYAIPIPARYLGRNPAYGAPGTVARGASYQQVFPLSPPHPWRLKRSLRPEWVSFYGAHEAQANGNFTACCGPLIYRAEAFPPDYHGDHFSCDAQQNLIHRAEVHPDGAGLRVTRAGEAGREFLRSADGWFRPVGLQLGPDGALYVVDMYREIIEDYSAIPRYLQQQYGLDHGNERGRIWRVAHVDAPALAGRELGDRRPEEWVAALAHPNAWWRIHAQRLLVEHPPAEAGALLKRQLRAEASPVGRLHTLRALEGLGELDVDDLLVALGDEHHGVRVHALRLADRRLDAALTTKLMEMVTDPEPSVRLQLALSLGESDDPRAAAGLANLARSHGDARWMEPAVLSSASEVAPALLTSLIDTPWVRPLMALVGAERRTESLDPALATLAGAEDALRQAEGLRGLVDGLAHGAPVSLRSKSVRDSLRALLASDSVLVRTQTFHVMRALDLEGDPLLEEAFVLSRDQALDEGVAVDERRVACQLLASAPYPLLAPIAALIGPRQPPELQLAAARALAACDDPRIAPLLLDGWRSHSPGLRAEVLDAVFRRADRLPGLLDALESGRVPPSELVGFQRLRLREHPDRRIRERAESILAKRRPRVSLDPYRAALSSGEAARGAKVFEELCSKCHHLGGVGAQVGPDLASANSRADQTLLEDLIWPNDRIAPGYSSYLVDTLAGESFTGTLAAETATAVTLRQEKGVEVTILRKDVDSMVTSKLSMMPNNMEELVNPQQAADVIAFLRRQVGEYVATAVLLFDDEEDFPSRLPEGDGRARLESSDSFSGQAHLSVRPLQSYSSRIEGWDFPIREFPGPGEYRYLRFAWRTDGGDGVLVEIADDGAWPPAGSEERRYYSGRNTTKWRARRVSPDPPGEWSVVTVDLWRDNGDFKLTGIAPTAMGGVAHFDRIELFGSLR